MSNTRLPRVGITHGDINGVGYEVILKTFADPAMLEICTPVIYGTAKACAYHRKALNLQLNTNIIASADEAADGKVNLISLSDEELSITLGQASAEAGPIALRALEQATADLKDKHIDVLVTAPVNKNVMQSDDFRFCGHTEYLQDRLSSGKPSSDEAAAKPVLGSQLSNPDDLPDDLPPIPIEIAAAPAAAPKNEEKEPAAPAPAAADIEGEALMILLNGQLRVALATTHLPLRNVADAVTTPSLVRKLRILDHSLRRDFSLTQPRIAVLSINPHAGDGGLLGNEEETVIKPAIAEAAKAKVHAYGPYAADGFFGSRAYEHFDAVLAMYHDQGLAAFKALAMDDGVNFTAGLSHVRTSPDHGVAYDIAGKGIANEASLRQAIYTAIDLQRNRNDYDQAHANPLHKLYRERREDERPFSRQPQMRV